MKLCDKPNTDHVRGEDVPFGTIVHYCINTAHTPSADRCGHICMAVAPADGGRNLEVIRVGSFVGGGQEHGTILIGLGYAHHIAQYQEGDIE